MQFIETALAFAITMLVLSMVVSTFVELIHRVFSMREAGLRYVMEQLFEQVLVKYVDPARVAAINNLSLPQKDRDDAQAYLDNLRTSFVQRMTSNRVPMGAIRKETPTAPAEQFKQAPDSSVVSWIKTKWSNSSVWNGRDLASMTPSQFMERLAALDVGSAVAEANKVANQNIQNAVGAAADVTDAVLKDVAQKFEAFGQDASSYFEGRARLMSVIVAMAFAVIAHVDAIELVGTFLRDPNVRTNVIKQVDAVMEQQKVSEEAVRKAEEERQKAKADAEKVRQNPPHAVVAPSPAAGVPVTADGATPVVPDEKKKLEAAQKEVDQLKEDLQNAIANTKKTLGQLNDYGVPIGWKSAETDTLQFWTKLPICVENKSGAERAVPTGVPCDTNTQYRKIVGWASLHLFASLLLGGFLIGLGAPFWRNAITGLTNIRSIASSVMGTNTQAKVAGAAADAAAERAQPVTPVGAFRAARQASL